MSKSFLTINEAYLKLGITGGGGGEDNFINKNDLINIGKCDISSLEKYQNKDFVIDDNIIMLSNLVFECYNTTFSTLKELLTLKPFNPSKPFTIEWDIKFNSLINLKNLVAFILLDNNNINLFWCACKTGYPSSNYNYYWVRAWELGEYKYDENAVAVNKIFSGVYLYTGNKQKPTVTSNLQLFSSSSVGTPLNTEGIKICFAGDSRDSVHPQYSVTINKLVILQ